MLRGTCKVGMKINKCNIMYSNMLLAIVIVYNCFREVIVLSRRITSPPPSTVSTVLAKRFGVRASKSLRSFKKFKDIIIIISLRKQIKGLHVHV